MIRVVALDLDGTTLSAAGTLSPFTEAVVRALSATGVEVLAATARRPGSALDLMPVGSVAVCSNGAMVVDRRARVLWEATFPRDELAAMAAWACETEPGLGFGIRCGDLLVANAAYLGLRRDPPPPDAVTVDGPADLAHFDAHSLSFRSPLAGVTSADLARTLAPGLAPDVGELSISGPHVLDIAPAGVDKATGLAWLGTRLGFGADQVVAYGDMPNDAAMLAWAGMGVAVGGAHSEAVAAADLVIGPAEDDAVASHLVELFGLTV